MRLEAVRSTVWPGGYSPWEDAVQFRCGEGEKPFQYCERLFYTRREGHSGMACAGHEHVGRWNVACIPLTTGETPPPKPHAVRFLLPRPAAAWHGGPLDFALPGRSCRPGFVSR
jgi:hypothetical protein